MNEGHAAAIILYAEFFGGQSNVSAAEMVDIDINGMVLNIDQEGIESKIRILFKTPLANADDARTTLVSMVKEAREG